MYPSSGKLKSYPGGPHISNSKKTLEKGQLSVTEKAQER